MMKWTHKNVSNVALNSTIASIESAWIVRRQTATTNSTWNKSNKKTLSGLGSMMIQWPITIASIE